MQEVEDIRARLHQTAMDLGPGAEEVRRALLWLAINIVEGNGCSEARKQVETTMNHMQEQLEKTS